MESLRGGKLMLPETVRAAMAAQKILELGGDSVFGSAAGAEVKEGAGVLAVVAAEAKRLRKKKSNLSRRSTK
jgi:hypothetical protein